MNFNLQNEQHHPKITRKQLMNFDIDKFLIMTSIIGFKQFRKHLFRIT